jgi:hypothetical protein
MRLFVARHARDEGAVCSLRQIPEDEAHIFVGDHGADSHVADDGGHGAWRKLVGRHVAAATVGAKSLFAFDAKRNIVGD